MGGTGGGWWGSPSWEEALVWADKISGVSQSLRLFWLGLHLICIAREQANLGGEETQG